MAETEPSFIPTRASLAKRNSNAETDFQSQAFKAYKKKVKKNEDLPTSPVKISEPDDSNRAVFKIKRAKHEVMQFGIAGFETLKKNEAKVQLAIKLGAKPPRKKYRNYKGIVEEKKKESLVKKSKIEFETIGKDSGGNSISQLKKYGRKKKLDQSIINLYGTTKGSKIK